MRSSAVLCVYPNVFAVADHRGRLSAAVRFDPDHGRAGSVHFVGAQMKKRPVAGFVRNAQNEKGVRKTIYDVTIAHSIDIQRVPHTDFFKRQIKDGALMPADEATARTVGVKFVEPQKALELARERLIAELLTLHPQEVVDGFVAKWPKFEIGRQPQANDKSTPTTSTTPKEDSAPIPSDGDKPQQTKTGAADGAEDGKEGG